MAALGLIVRLIDLVAALLAMWRSQRERQAGRAEIIIEQREAADAALDKADQARARRRRLDADDDGLRADDGFRRD